MCWIRPQEKKTEDQVFVPGITEVDELKDEVKDEIEDSLFTINAKDGSEAYTMIGDWEIKDNKYKIFKDGECGFAAVYHHQTGFIVVEWSKHCLLCKDVDPIFTVAYEMDHVIGKCGDLDNDGIRPAYSLPSELFRN